MSKIDLETYKKYKIDEKRVFKYSGISLQKIGFLRAMYSSLK